jgi:hypothetical protein
MTKVLMGWNATEVKNAKGRSFDCTDDAMNYLWHTPPVDWPNTMVLVEGNTTLSVNPFDWLEDNIENWKE